jgi:hypothetical protein
VYGYDTEADADLAVQAYLEKKEPGNEQVGVTKRTEDEVMGWFMPKRANEEGVKAKL